jgi:hypothetical protein
MMADLTSDRAHVVSLSQRRLGHAPVSGRPLYGWTWKCSCGATGKVNGPKREAVNAWRDHATCRVNQGKTSFRPCGKLLKAGETRCTKHREAP